MSWCKWQSVTSLGERGRKLRGVRGEEGEGEGEGGVVGGEAEGLVVVVAVAEETATSVVLSRASLIIHCVRVCSVVKLKHCFQPQLALHTSPHWILTERVLLLSTILLSCTYQVIYVLYAVHFHISYQHNIIQKYVFVLNSQVCWGTIGIVSEYQI